MRSGQRRRPPRLLTQVRSLDVLRQQHSADTRTTASTKAIEAAKAVLARAKETPEVKPQVAPPEHDTEEAALDSDVLTRAVAEAEALASRLEAPSTGKPRQARRRVTRSATARSRSEPVEEAATPTPDVPVTFAVRKHVPFGSRVTLVGSSAALGRWRLDRAVPMAWSPGDLWRSPPVMLSVNSAHAYKYVILSPNSVETWQPGPNQCLVVDEQDMPGIGVTDSWSGSPGEASITSGPNREQRAADERLDDSVRRLHASLVMAQKLAADAYGELLCTQAVVEALREEVSVHQAALQTAQRQAEQEREHRASLAQQLGAFKEAVQGVRQQLASRLHSAEGGGSGRRDDQAR